MIKKIRYIIFLLFISCSQDFYVPDKPKDLIEKKKFEKILFEVSFAESYYQIADPGSTVIRESLDSTINVILKQHEVTDSAFKSSMNYYAQNHEELNEMYVNILDSLRIVKP